jgi:hypothetical protein
MSESSACQWIYHILLLTSAGIEGLIGPSGLALIVEISEVDQLQSGVGAGLYSIGDVARKTIALMPRIDVWNIVGIDKQLEFVVRCRVCTALACSNDLHTQNSLSVYATDTITCHASSCMTIATCPFTKVRQSRGRQSGLGHRTQRKFCSVDDTLSRSTGCVVVLCGTPFAIWWPHESHWTHLSTCLFAMVLRATNGRQ